MQAGGPEQSLRTEESLFLSSQHRKKKKKNICILSKAICLDGSTEKD